MTLYIAFLVVFWLIVIFAIKDMLYKIAGFAIGFLLPTGINVFCFGIAVYIVYRILISGKTNGKSNKSTFSLKESK